MILDEELGVVLPVVLRVLLDEVLCMVSGLVLGLLLAMVLGRYPVLFTKGKIETSYQPFYTMIHSGIFSKFNIDGSFQKLIG